MDPVVIYFKELEFDILQRFTLGCSENNKLKKIFFSTSMICYLKLETNITNNKNLEKNKDLSKIAKQLEQNGFDSLFQIESIDFIYDNIARKEYFNKRKFNVVKNKEKIYTFDFKYYDPMKKIYIHIYIYTQYTHHILNSNLKVLHSKKNNNFTT